MILVAYKCGQLGNRMFAYAHLIANAKANGLTIANPSFDEYAEYFETTRKDLFCRFPPQRLGPGPSWLRSFVFLITRVVFRLFKGLRFFSSPVHQILIADLPEYKFSEFRNFDLGRDQVVATLKRKPISIIFGRFFRDYVNLEKHQDTVRDYFKPARSIEMDVHDFLLSQRKGIDVLIGVHARRGDYAQFVDGIYFFSFEQYFEKMREAKLAFHGKRLRFIICSNEKVPLDLPDDLDIVVGPGRMVHDLYTLAGCDYLMGPPSTFSLWASFYGKKPIAQIRDINDPVTLDSFRILPREILFNFSFN